MQKSLEQTSFELNEPNTETIRKDAEEIFKLMDKYFVEELSLPKDIKQGIDFLTEIFDEIAHTIHLQDAFGSLTKLELRDFSKDNCLEVLKKAIAEPNADSTNFVNSTLQIVVEKIQKFKEAYSKQIKRSLDLKELIDTISDRCDALSRTLHQVWLLQSDPKLSDYQGSYVKRRSALLQFSLEEDKILRQTRDEILRMGKILAQVAGTSFATDPNMKVESYDDESRPNYDDDGEIGYITLSKEDKKLYDQLPTLFRGWQNAFEIITKYKIETLIMVGPSYACPPPPNNLSLYLQEAETLISNLEKLEQINTNTNQLPAVLGSEPSDSALQKEPQETSSQAQGFQQLSDTSITTTTTTTTTSSTQTDSDEDTQSASPCQKQRQKSSSNTAPHQAYFANQNSYSSQSTQDLKPVSDETVKGNSNFLNPPSK